MSRIGWKTKDDSKKFFKSFSRLTTGSGKAVKHRSTYLMTYMSFCTANLSVSTSK
jgi:hypothetical protein